MAGAPTVLDDQALSRLHEDFASTGDLDEFARLIRNFLVSGAQQVEEAAAAAERGDSEVVRAAGHKLKGSSRTLGASLAGAAAARVERAGAEGDVAAARRALGELEEAFSLTRSALSHVVDAIDGGEPA